MPYQYLKKILAVISTGMFALVDFSPKMMELLAAGKTLIVDRYSFSGVAFTAAKPVSISKYGHAPNTGTNN